MIFGLSDLLSRCLSSVLPSVNSLL